ncbi:MAG: glycosyltransferase family 39 protein [bacterium]
MTGSNGLNHKETLFESSALPVIIIFILALVLRLFRLSGANLRYDELALHFLSRLPSRTLLKTVRDWGHDWSPVYPFFSHWYPGTAASPFFFRLPSAVFGALTTVYLIKLGTRLFSRRSALIAGFLLAVAPWHIYMSREAGYAAFYALSITIQLWYFFRAREDSRYWIHFTLVSLLAAYTSYNFIPFFFWQMLTGFSVYYFFAFLFQKTVKSNHLAKWGISCFLTIAGFYYWVIFLFKRPPKEPFTAPFFYYNYPAWDKMMGDMFSVGWMGLLIIMLFSLWGWYRKRKSVEVWELGVMAAGAIPVAYQLTYPLNPYFVMRQLLYLLPLVLLFFAHGIEGIITKYEAPFPGSRFRWLVLAALLLFFNRGAVGFDFSRVGRFPPDWEKVARDIFPYSKRKIKSRIIVLDSASKMLLEFYATPEIFLKISEKTTRLKFPFGFAKKRFWQMSARNAFLKYVEGPFRSKGYIVFYEPYVKNTGENSLFALIRSKRFGRYFHKVREIASPSVYKYDFPLMVFDDFRIRSFKNTPRRSWGRKGIAVSDNLNEISDRFQLRYMAYRKGEYKLTVIKKKRPGDGENLSVYNNGKFIGELRFNKSNIGSLDLYLTGEDSTLTLKRKSAPVAVKYLNLNRLVERSKVIYAGDFTAVSFKKIIDIYWSFQGNLAAVLKGDGYVGYDFALKNSGRYRLAFCALHSKPAPISLRMWVDGKPLDKYYFARQDRTWGVGERIVQLKKGFHEIRIERYNREKSKSGHAIIKWIRVIKVDGPVSWVSLNQHR